LNCCTFEFSRNFASIWRRVLYYDSPGGACRALTFALARLSCNHSYHHFNAIFFIYCEL